MWLSLSWNDEISLLLTRNILIRNNKKCLFRGLLGPWGTNGNTLVSLPCSVRTFTTLSIHALQINLRIHTGHRSWWTKVTKVQVTNIRVTNIRVTNVQVTNVLVTNVCSPDLITNIIYLPIKPHYLISIARELNLRISYLNCSRLLAMQKIAKFLIDDIFYL